MLSELRSKRTIRPLTTAALHEIPKLKEEIKAKLPSLQARDIRRYRVPYSEVVVLELQEDGHSEAAQYFEFLFKYDENTKNTAGPDTAIWDKPWLKRNKELIDDLRKMLVKAFDETLSAEARTVCMIQEALRIEDLSKDWWWIADILYRSAFELAKNIENSNNEIVNELRYIYARLLFYKLDNAKLALEYVRLAQIESRDRLWDTSAISGFKSENLFSQCCVLMHKVLVRIAQEMRETDTETAVTSSIVALDSAFASCQKELVAEAEYELGRSQAAAGNLKDAVDHFFASLAIFEDIPDPEGICKIHSTLALTYKDINDKEKVLEHFQKFKDTASEFNLAHNYATAHYLTGEFYLAQNDPKKATLNFDTAFLMYSRLGARDDANRTRCLTGISKGRYGLIKTNFK